MVKPLHAIKLRDTEESDLDYVLGRRAQRGELSVFATLVPRKTPSLVTS
jgi:hypothetical protein